MADDAISKAVGEAKKTLNDANSKFPAKAPATTPVARAKPAKASPPSTIGDPTIGPSLAAKKKNEDDYINALPKMHSGGTVPKDGPYNLQKGETVTPAGRNSEYRQVYMKRMAAKQQERGEGGNSPVTKTPEKHDEKKATKGIAEKND